jgi:hypothetical protein
LLIGKGLDVLLVGTLRTGSQQLPP